MTSEHAHEDERTVTFTGVRNWPRLQGEIAPALRRDFPGVIVEIDERVIYSQIPDPTWCGATIKVIGIEQRTSDFLVNAFVREVMYDRFQNTRVNAADAKRLDEHRAAMRAGRRAGIRPAAHV